MARIKVTKLSIMMMMMMMLDDDDDEKLSDVKARRRSIFPARISPLV